MIDNRPIPDFLSDSRYLKNLWQASNGGLVLCNPSKKIIGANLLFQEIFKQDEDTLKGADLDMLITPAPYLGESDTLVSIVLDGTPISIITERIDSAGDPQRVYLTTSSITTDSHRSYILFSFKPVPPEKEKRSYDRLTCRKTHEAAFENSCEPSVVTNAYGVVINCNSAFSAEFKYHRDQILGRNVAETLISPVILPEADYINAMAAAGRLLRLSTTRLRSDDTEVQVSLVSMPLPDGNIHRIFRTADSMAMTKADLCSANSLCGCPDPEKGNGMIFQCRTDRQRSMEFLLPGSAFFTGYTEEQLLSGEKSFASAILANDREMVLKKVRDSLKTGKEYNVTYRLRNKDGQILWVMEQGHSRQTGGEAPDFCEGCIIDITETREESGNGDNARERIDSLHGIAGDLQRSRSVGEIYRVCAEAGRSILNGVCSCIFLQDTDRMKLVASSGKENYPCDSGCSLDMADVAMNTAGPCYFRSRDKKEGFCPAGKSGVCFKLGNRAVFQVMSNGTGMFGNVDTRILELLVGYTEQALKRIALQHQLINQALHDPLTGIYNRNYFNRLIQLEEHRARRLDSAISFIMVDVDNFKMINDRFGHQAGDRVLQEVAKVLEGALRKTDTVLRYGGDEFLIILTRMTSDYTHIVEARISRALEKHASMEQISGERISVSMGHAYWTPDVDKTIDEILKIADMIMFENKRKKVKKAP